MSILHVLRVPILISILVGLVLSLPDQSRELYRALAQNVRYWNESWLPRVQLTLAVIGIVLIALCVWSVAFTLANKSRDRIPVYARRGADLAARITLIIITSAAALGFYHAQTPSPSSTVEQAVMTRLHQMYPTEIEPVINIIYQRLIGYNALLLTVSVVLGCIGIVLAAVVPSVTLKTALGGSPSLCFGRYKALLGYSAVATIIACFVFVPTIVTQFMGTVFIFSIFVVCLVSILGHISYWSDRHKIPYLIIILIAAFLFSLADINDNHSVLPNALTVKAITPSRSLDSDFAQWWASRPDRSRYEQSSNRYPIYVVAAEGGGIYAAFHTASVLGGLQEDCPAFAHHLFAISSVFGGSVGASAFAGLLVRTEAESLIRAVESPCRSAPRPYRMSLVDLTDTLLAEDFLSPLVAGLLFPDFFQRFLPFPLAYRYLDRSLYLERAFEQAMDSTVAKFNQLGREDKAVGPNFLALPYTDHWDPKGSSPALVFNTTEVGSGRRRIISPFEFSTDTGLFLSGSGAGSNSQSKNGGLRVSTAAFMSARFTWITPAASFYVTSEAAPPSGLKGKAQQPGHTTKVRLVDGGYFENSGVATALDLVRSMQAAAKQHKFDSQIDIHLIILTRGTYPEQTFYGLDEMISPVNALLNTRTSRAYITIAEAKRDFQANRTGGSPASGSRTRFYAFTHRASGSTRDSYEVKLLDMDYTPPLGWSLSPMTILLIQAQNGVSKACNVPAPGDGPSVRAGFAADCLWYQVQQQLH